MNSYWSPYGSGGFNASNPSVSGKTTLDIPYGTGPYGDGFEWEIDVTMPFRALHASCPTDIINKGFLIRMTNSEAIGTVYIYAKEKDQDGDEFLDKLPKLEVELEHSFGADAGYAWVQPNWAPEDRINSMHDDNLYYVRHFVENLSNDATKRLLEDFVYDVYHNHSDMKVILCYKVGDYNISNPETFANDIGEHLEWLNNYPSRNENGIDYIGGGIVVGIEIATKKINRVIGSNPVESQQATAVKNSPLTISRLLKKLEAIPGGRI